MPRPAAALTAPRGASGRLRERAATREARAPPEPSRRPARLATRWSRPPRAMGGLGAWDRSGRRRRRRASRRRLEHRLRVEVLSGPAGAAAQTRADRRSRGARGNLDVDLPRRRGLIRRQTQQGQKAHLRHDRQHHGQRQEPGQPLPRNRLGDGSGPPACRWPSYLGGLTAKRKCWAPPSRARSIACTTMPLGAPLSTATISLASAARAPSGRASTGVRPAASRA